MYSQNVATECRGTKIITNHITQLTGRPPIIITDRQLQQTIGDLIITTDRGTTTLELKIEERHTGNLFIEEWSNREWGKPGWLFTSQAQLITFYFIDSDQAYTVSLPALKHWLLNQFDGTFNQLHIVKAKQSGPNDTYGRLLPIDMLRAAQLEGWWEAQPRHELEQRNEQETN